MTESSETYPRSFIPAEAGCYVYPASRVTKCIRRHPPSSARACASLSFDRFDGNRAEGSSTLESRPRFDLFHFLFSLEKGRKNATLLKASGTFFSLSSLSSLLIRTFFTGRNNEDMHYIKKLLREERNYSRANEFEI